MPTMPKQLVVCTVITPDYVDKALSIYRSIGKFATPVRMVALVTGVPHHECDEIELLTLPKLTRISEPARRAAALYPEGSDELRWTLKSIIMSHLIEQGNSEAVLYADSDTCFFRDPGELCQELGDGDILLTPHWRPHDPLGLSQEFVTNFMDGLFNAGCVLARASGNAALEWWAEACLARCDVVYSQGLFVDQKYLDLMPVWFPGTVICRNRGYNLAQWNVQLRTLDAKTSARDVPDRWPVSMVHFTASTIALIEGGGDPVLVPYLKEYKEICYGASRDLRPARSLLSNPQTFRCPGGNAPDRSKRVSVANAARKKLPTRTIKDALAAAAAFTNRLDDASIKALICDSDALVTKRGGRTPIALNRMAMEHLSSLAERGMVIGLVSRRGYGFVSRVLATMSPSSYGSTWIGCFSGALVGPLCDIGQLQQSEKMSWVLDNVVRRFGTSSVQMITHLTQGGQITLRVEPEHLAPRVQLSLSELLDALGLIGWRAFSSGSVITILDSASGKLKLVDAIRVHYGMSLDEMLCIGVHGAEGEGDFELLGTPLSLSVGSTSLDPATCWRFCKNVSMLYPASNYLPHIHGDGGSFNLPVERLLSGANVRNFG